MLTVLGVVQRHDEAVAAFACLGRKGGARGDEAWIVPL
jgi:hypothetical protein